LKEAEAALDRGEHEQALRRARDAYEASPDRYPDNYNALSVALDCMVKLDLKEEAEIVQGTMEKLLMEHDTRRHAEGEARKKHPLREDKTP
jgi:hypothetical protein